MQIAVTMGAHVQLTRRTLSLAIASPFTHYTLYGSLCEPKNEGAIWPDCAVSALEIYLKY